MTDVLSTIVSQLVSPDTLSTLSTAAKDAFNLIKNELKSVSIPSLFPSKYTVVLPATSDILGLINNNTLTAKQKANIIANHIVYNPTQCSLAGKRTLTAVSNACLSKDPVLNNLVLPQRYELKPGCVITDFTNVSDC